MAYFDEKRKQIILEEDDKEIQRECEQFAKMTREQKIDRMNEEYFTQKAELAECRD